MTEYPNLPPNLKKRLDRIEELDYIGFGGSNE